MKLRTISLLALAASLLAQGCKKDNPQAAYPVKYRFAEIGNLSGIATYDAHGSVSAPSNESATAPYIKNFQDSVSARVGQNFSGTEITLLSSTQIEFRNPIDVNTTGYARSGDTVKVAGFYGNYADTAYFRLTGKELHLMQMAYAFQRTLSGSVERQDGTGAYSKDPYHTLYGGQPNRNDTIAVRSFDVIYRQ